MKTKITQWPRISADKIAQNLRGTFPRNKMTGEDKAMDIAKRTFRALDSIQPDDLTPFMQWNDVQKGKRIWEQVRNILKNEKGFTLVELMLFMAIMSCTALLLLGTLWIVLHFVSKFW